MHTSRHSIKMNVYGAMNGRHLLEIIHQLQTFLNQFDSVETLKVLGVQSFVYGMSGVNSLIFFVSGTKNHIYWYSVLHFPLSHESYKFLDRH